MDVFLLIALPVIGMFIVSFLLQYKRILSLDKKNRDLVALNEAKDLLISVISHDLRSPVGTIIGISDMLNANLQEKDYSSVEKCSDFIASTSRQTLDLLTSLFDWNQSQNGRIEFQPVTFCLETLIKETLPVYSSIAIQKSITIVLESGQRTSVNADKFMVGAILRNLISNAIKFTKPGGEIYISIKKKTDQLMICVQDSGIGMSREMIEKLFLLSERHSTPGTNREMGTGLGLILCKEFVEKHGGKIWAESEEGKGSTFCFTLPC